MSLICSVSEFDIFQTLPVSLQVNFIANNGDRELFSNCLYILSNVLQVFPDSLETLSVRDTIYHHEGVGPAQIPLGVAVLLQVCMLS